jgi:hypothetical protein
MTPNPAIVKSVEQLGYRVTLGDVAAQAGLELNLAQQGLLALASDAGGHLQVSETGDIVYLFPRNFRAILRNKFWRLRLKETWEKVWNVLFYLIRISFGIVLVLSILLMMVAIALILIAISSSRDSDSNSGSGNSGSSGGGFDIVFLPNFFDLFWIFSPDYNQERYQEKKSYAAQSEGSAKEMNILEAIFSFLFGDGNPNRNLEERRWQEIGAVIRNNGGAVIAQQLAPYLDTINRYNEETEDYILPVLARFNGSPQVSPVGDIIYYFPELQVTANKRTLSPVATYLRENLWRFTQAGSGQIIAAIGLGGLNFILALVLGSLLQGGVASQLGGLVALVASIYWILLGYAIGFLGIPLLRYFWIQWSNGKISSRNQARQERVEQLNQSDRALRQKIDYARQFAAQKVITDADITYSTQTDLLEQEIQRSDQIDREWQQRLQSGS